MSNVANMATVRNTKIVYEGLTGCDFILHLIDIVHGNG